MQVLDLQEVLARVQQQVHGVLHHPGLVQEGAAPRRHRPVRDGYVVHPLHAQQPREDGSKDVSAPHRLQLALQADLLRRGRGRLERRCGRLAVAVAVRRLLALALVDELHQRLVKEHAHQTLEVPRGCNRPPQALARFPPLGACIGRGPAQLYKYKAYNPTAWCAGFVPTRPNADGNGRRSRTILRRKGPIFPLCTCLDCRGVAGKRGTTRLQPTTASSSSISSTRCLHRKRSRSIPSSCGSDTAYGRYIHKYVHNHTLNIKVRSTLQI